MLSTFYAYSLRIYIIMYRVIAFTLLFSAESIVKSLQTKGDILIISTHRGLMLSSLCGMRLLIFLLFLVGLQAKFVYNRLMNFT